MDKKTPLYDLHLELGAKLAPFAGYKMPIQYSGIVLEHQTVRTSAGLFDVSHMGHILIEGPNSIGYLQRLLPGNVAKIPDGGVLYSALLYPNGTVVDDLLVYRLASHTFKIIANASNVQKDFDWMASHLKGEVSLVNESEKYGTLALQGPKSEEILQKLSIHSLNDLKAFHCKQFMINGSLMWIARTGYTGEDGFELFPEKKDVVSLWQAILNAGKDMIRPVGLGARDTLRLESGYSLYGHELSDNTNLLEAGLGWIVDFEKGPFIGSENLINKKAMGLQHKLVGLEMIDRAIPRSGCPVFYHGKEVGHVTSGTQSPTLGKGIALAYVDATISKLGTEMDVVIRDAPKKAKIVGRSFYKVGK